MKKYLIYIIIGLLTLNNNAYAETKHLIVKTNKNICKNIKEKYKIDVMKEWSVGLDSDKNFLKEINKNINMLKKQKNMSGEIIKKNITLWIKSEEDIKKGIEEGNINLVTNATNNKIKIITEFNKICKKIK